VQYDKLVLTRQQQQQQQHLQADYYFIIRAGAD